MMIQPEFHRCVTKRLVPRHERNAGKGGGGEKVEINPTQSTTHEFPQFQQV